MSVLAHRLAQRRGSREDAALLALEHACLLCGMREREAGSSYCAPCGRLWGPMANAGASR